MNKNIRNAIIILPAVVVIGVVGFGAYTLGNNSNTSTGTEQNSGQGNFGGNMPNGQDGMRGGFGMDFSQFVEDGIIDQDTADKMQAYMEEQMQNMQNGQNGTPGGGMDIFSGMVEEGIITQEQADKIQESMPQMGQGMPGGGFGGN